MNINNKPAVSNASVTEITGNAGRNGVEHSLTWVRPTPDRHRGFPGCCPRPPRPDHRAIIAQLQSLISMLSDLLRRMGGKPGMPVQPKPPAAVDVKPMPSELQRFVGMSARDAEAKARQEGITNIRIIKPFEPVTADSQRDRLNLSVNEAGTVTRADWY
jgi:hypothetical protein